MKKTYFEIIGVIAFTCICIVCISLIYAVRPTSLRVSEPEKPISQSITIERVVDGDTVVVRDPVEGLQKIRLIGVNAPESVDPRKKVECYGKEASAYLKNMLPKDTVVVLVSDTTQQNVDVYGRYLRYVQMATSTDVGLLLIEQGFAHQYLYKNPYEKYDMYVDAEQKAKENKRGLWSSLCM